jgi:hypothetical protein
VQELPSHDEHCQDSLKRTIRKIRVFISIAATLVPIILGISYAILKQTTSYLVFLFSLFFSLLSTCCLIAVIIVGIWVQRSRAYRALNPCIMMKRHQYYWNVVLALTWSALALFIATFLLFIFTFPRAF